MARGDRWCEVIAWGVQSEKPPTEDEVVARIDDDLLSRWLRSQLPASAEPPAKFDTCYSIMGDCVTLLTHVELMIILEAAAAPNPQSVVWRIVHDKLRLLTARDALREIALGRGES